MGSGTRDHPPKRRFRGRYDGPAVKGCTVIGHEPDRVDRGPVDLDLEVEVQSGAGPGGALDTDPLPDSHASSRDDLGVNTGEVPVAGDNTIPVTQGSDVSVDGL
jgi:hypothetical protein